MKTRTHFSGLVILLCVGLLYVNDYVENYPLNQTQASTYHQFKQTAHLLDWSNEQANKSTTQNRQSPHNEQFTLTDFYADHPILTQQVNQVYDCMSLEERAAQMIVSALGSNAHSRKHIISLLKNNKIGNIMFLGNVQDGHLQTTKILNWVAKDKQISPLLYSIDAEPSLINGRIKTGIPRFAKTNRLKTTGKTRQTADQIATILLNHGIQHNYAPVCDYAINKEVIAHRSFSSNGEVVKELSTAFIEATQAKNVVATAKHFPGHGNVKGDSHHEFVHIDGALQELDVFRESIAKGVLSIMVGHISVRNNPNYNTFGLPASLSPRLVQGLLREELGFQGIIITDAMNMKGANGVDNPDLKAALAGNDLILMPKDETKLHADLMEQVLNNSSFAEQFESSVKRIIRLKMCLNLPYPERLKQACLSN